MTSEANIKRNTRSVTITLGTATAAATVLRTEDMAGAVISVGTMSTAAATLQIWGAATEGGEYRQLFKADGSAATITLAPSTSFGRIYALPDEIFALPFVRVISGATNSTGTVGIVTFKS